MTTPRLDVTVAPEAEGTVLTVVGTLDLATCADLVVHLRQAHRRPGHVVVDLSGVDTLGGVAVGILARARSELNGQGRRLVLRGVQPDVVEFVASA